MSGLIKPNNELYRGDGVRVIDNRGVPEGPPCLVKYVQPPIGATLGEADVLIQQCQREARDAGVVWFVVTQPVIGVFKVQGWDHKPTGA